MKVMLGARTSRPHSERSSLSPLALALALERFFALRAQCGRDVRAPSLPVIWNRRRNHKRVAFPFLRLLYGFQLFDDGHFRLRPFRILEPSI
jgi:hypothetical protein